MLHARHVLAFDSALNGCAAALFDVKANKLTAESEAMERGQAEHLVPMIGRVLDKAGVKYADIDVIGVTVGPGAFTGLRIALSTARALGLALDRPVLGVTTLECIARQYLQSETPDPDQTLAVVLETKRADFYVQFFAPEGFAEGPPAALAENDLFAAARGRRIVAIGDGVTRLHMLEAAKDWTLCTDHMRPDPGILAHIVASTYAHAARGTVFARPEPLYLRPPDVSMPKRKTRTLAEG